MSNKKQEQKPLTIPNIEYKVICKNKTIMRTKNPMLGEIYKAKATKTNSRIVSVEEVKPE